MFNTVKYKLRDPVVHSTHIYISNINRKLKIHNEYHFIRIITFYDIKKHITIFRMAFLAKLNMTDVGLQLKLFIPEEIFLK